MSHSTVDSSMPCKFSLWPFARMARDGGRAIFNQVYNLMPMPSRGFHTSLHASSLPYRFWYGTPQWAKATLGSTAGHAALAGRSTDAAPDSGSKIH